MEQNRKASLFANHTVQESVLFFIMAIALMAYALYKHYTGLPVSWEMSPYLFPVLIAIFLLLLSVSLFTDGRKQVFTQSPEVEAKASKVVVDWKSTLFTVVASVVYFLLMPVITFIPATILFLLAMLWYLKERRWWLMAILSVATTGIIYVMFGVLLNVMLP